MQISSLKFKRHFSGENVVVIKINKNKMFNISMPEERCACN
uniref:Uncharacterized protein n=1 Tax=Anguilla anguilla TaxID=7936 RepID=A0A0E9XVP9_ANGAN